MGHPRDKIKLEVWVNLDPVPGLFHTKESARQVVSDILRDQIPHYNPSVALPPED